MMDLDDKIKNVKSPLAWATSLTQAEVAGQLRKLSVNIHILDADDRKALLMIAADDLERTIELPRRVPPIRTETFSIGTAGPVRVKTPESDASPTE